MKKFKTTVLLIILVSFGLLCLGDTERKDTAVYRIRKQDAVLQKIDDKNEAALQKNEQVTAEILKKQAEIAKKKIRKVLRFDMTGINKPESPEQFKNYFHFPPVAQYSTGTCWSFAQTSFYESEVYRLYGKKVKLSEMYTVYHEYIEKALGYVRTRGKSLFAQGSEGDAVDRIWQKYGIVPLEVYDGILAEDGLHNHDPLHEEMHNFLKWMRDNNYWDEKWAEAGIRLILDRHMGEPPKEFTYEGKKYTPVTFLKEVVKINPDDYIQFQSVLSQPFWTMGEYEVEDNWWHSENYCNIPLEDFMTAINNSIKNGYTLSIGGDVSEPGYNGYEKAQIIPSFDIPGDYIDQSARELRIYQNTTEDDHGIHMIGYLEMDGHNWYLIKDSARSARQKEPHGYHYYRDDYVKLKMLTFCVHRDAVKELIKKIETNAPKEKELKLTEDGPFKK